MLFRLIMKGKIGRWTIALSEFRLQYVPQKTIKWQALVAFLANHPCISINEKTLKKISIGIADVKPWELWFNGSRKKHGAGAGIILISPHGHQISLTFLLEFSCSNN